MTNQVRLKILGLGLMAIGLGAFFLFVGYRPPYNPIVFQSLMFGMLALPIIGLVCYAWGKGRSLFWGAMGLFPFVGPVFGLAAITVDDLLAKLSAPKLLRRLVTSLVAVSGPALILAIVIPNYLRMHARSPHSEARLNLLAIYVAESSFKAEVERYGTFAEVGFDIDPSHSNRYTYRINNSGKPGTVFPAKDGTFTPDNTVVHAGVSADGQCFTATATANLDDDPTLDQWHVNDTSSQAVHDVDDHQL